MISAGEFRNGVTFEQDGQVLQVVEFQHAHCGLCVVHCPAGAITKGDELNVDETKCIKCCACVKVCPRNAKVYDTPFAALLSDCFKKQKQPQTIL